MTTAIAHMYKYIFQRSEEIVGAKAMRIEATIYIVRKISSGERLPRTSHIGTITSCPIPSQSKHAVKLNWTSEAFVLNSQAILGNDGKYMSIVSGPNAVRKPSSKANL